MINRLLIVTKALCYNHKSSPKLVFEHLKYISINHGFLSGLLTKSKYNKCKANNKTKTMINTEYKIKKQKTKNKNII